MDSILKGNVIPYGQACNQIPQNGLIASYLLQGTAEDETGTYNGTETSMAYAYDDNSGIVAIFNGTSSYIGIPHTGLPSGSANRAISCWFSFNSYTSKGAIFEYGTSSSGQRFGIRATATTIGVDISGSFIFYDATISTELWHNVVVSLDGTDLSSGISIYLDGVLLTSVNSLANNTINTVLSDANFGTYLNKSVYSDCSISNAHIYNRALTAQEVTDIYNIEKYQHNNALDMGLIAYYPLDGNSLDNAINQYDGTDTSVSYVADTDMGNIVSSYGGVNSNVLLSNTLTDLIGTGSFTASLWVKVDAWTTSKQTPICFEETFVNGIRLQIDESGNGTDKGARFWFRLNDATWVSLIASLTITIGDWNHFVITYDTTDGRAIYFNSTQSDTDAYVGATYPPLTSYRNSIGSRNADDINYTVLNGAIANLRIYNRALSQKEIEWLYDYEKPNSTECIANSTIDNPDPFGDGSGVALYKLDGNANDTTGNYNGTPTSITYAGGEFGRCAVFGDSKYINVSALTRASIGDNIAISLWFKKTVGDYEWLITIDGRREILWNYAGGNIYARVNTQTPVLEGDAEYADGYWHHIVVNFEGAGATAMYIDGTLKGTSTVKSTFSNTGSRIGGYPTLTGAYCFGGNIDQVRIFNRALTANEITKLCNERKV